MTEDSGTILLAGGGTAGHVNPLLAVAAFLRANYPQYSRLVLGTREGLEAELVPAAGEELYTIPRLPFPRRPSPDLAKLPFRLRRTVADLRALLRERGVRVVIGFGGYVSTPIYLAAHRENVPVVIHEQNAVAGLANKVGARHARAVLLTFPQTSLHARRGETKVVGLPLRETIVDLARARAGGEGAARRAAGAARFELDPARPIALVTGGSLGALHLNQVAPAVLLDHPELQVIHLTGKGKAAEVSAAVAAVAGAEERYRVLEYLSEMELALGAADFVICRSGAGTVSEMNALGLPAVYVPLPIGNGEQAKNAAAVVAAGGALLIPDKELTPARLEGAIETVLAPGKLERMGAATAGFGVLDAAAQIAAAAVAEIGGSRG